MYLVADSIGKLDKSKKFANKAEEKNATAYQKDIEKVTKFIPVWVKFAVALALGFGTMIGWKRIVVTVGEKIGKEHLTYAQGASAELVVRPPGQHHTCSLVGHRGNHGGQRLRPAVRHSAQYYPSVGAHSSRLCPTRRHDILRRNLLRPASLARALTRLSLDP
jgi:hypothetical protein